MVCPVFPVLFSPRCFVISPPLHLCSSGTAFGNASPFVISLCLCFTGRFALGFDPLVFYLFRPFDRFPFLWVFFDAPFPWVVPPLDPVFHEEVLWDWDLPTNPNVFSKSFRPQAPKLLCFFFLRFPSLVPPSPLSLVGFRKVHMCPLKYFLVLLIYLHRHPLPFSEPVWQPLFPILVRVVLP